MGEEPEGRWNLLVGRGRRPRGTRPGLRGRPHLRRDQYFQGVPIRAKEVGHHRTARSEPPDPGPRTRGAARPETHPTLCPHRTVRIDSLLGPSVHHKRPTCSADGRAIPTDVEDEYTRDTVELTEALSWQGDHIFLIDTSRILSLIHI